MPHSTSSLLQEDGRQCSPLPSLFPIPYYNNIPSHDHCDLQQHFNLLFPTPSSFTVPNTLLIPPFSGYKLNLAPVSSVSLAVFYTALGPPVPQRYRPTHHCLWLPSAAPGVGWKVTKGEAQDVAAIPSSFSPRIS